MNHASRGATAFTLIELLVTVSIIAVLALITLPVIRAVRVSSQTTICSSNIRQCGIALLTYGGDFEGRIDARYGGWHFGNAQSWRDTLMTAGFFEKHGNQYMDGGLGTGCPTAHAPNMGRSTANAYLGHFNAYDTQPGEYTAPNAPSSDPGNSYGVKRHVAEGTPADAMLIEYSRTEWTFPYTFWSYGNHWDNTNSPRSLGIFWWDGHVSRARADRNEIYSFYEIWVPHPATQP